MFRSYISKRPFFSSNIVALFAGIVGGATAAVSGLGSAFVGLVAMFGLASAGAKALLCGIVVSSGVGLSFITGNQKLLLPGLGGATFEGVRLTLVVGAFIIAIALGRVDLGHLKKIGSYLGFLLIAAISLLWSPDSGAGVRLLVRLVYPVAAFGACAVVASEQGDRLFRQWCCWAVVLGTVLNLYVAVSGWSQYGGVGYQLRYHGSSGPMDFGLFCAAGGLTLYAFWCHHRGRIYLPLAVLLWIQMVATGTRTSVIAGGVGYMTFELVHRRFRRVFVALALGLTVWLLVPTLGERTTRSDTGSEYSVGPGGTGVNLSGRAVIWADVGNGLIGDSSIFGSGLGATQNYMASRYILPSDVHNAYLLFLADIGIVGLIGFAVFCITMAIELVRRIGHSTHSTNYPALSLGLLVIIILCGATQNPLYVYGTAPMFLFTTFALATSPSVGRPDRSKSS